MKTNKPEIVAWRWRKPVVNDQGETVGATAWELSDAPGFLPWWTNDPLVRLSDYEALQAERDAAFALLRECQLILREECGARIDYVELNAFLKGRASAMDILAALDDTAGGSLSTYRKQGSGS